MAPLARHPGFVLAEIWVSQASPHCHYVTAPTSFSGEHTRLAARARALPRQKCLNLMAMALAPPELAKGPSAIVNPKTAGRRSAEP